MANPWQTHGKAVIYPWQSRDSLAETWICGENRVIANPWQTRGRPMIYPWQVVFFFMVPRAIFELVSRLSFFVLLGSE